MGRKRGITKGKLTLSVDEKLIEELNDDGVNKSKLFSLSAKKYLREKKKMSNKRKK